MLKRLMILFVCFHRIRFESIKMGLFALFL